MLGDHHPERAAGEDARLTIHRAGGLSTFDERFQPARFDVGKPLLQAREDLAFEHVRHVDGGTEAADALCQLLDRCGAAEDMMEQCDLRHADSVRRSLAGVTGP